MKLTIWTKKKDIAPRRSFLFARHTSTKKQPASVTIGVDIGHSELRLVKVVKNDDKSEIVKHQVFPLPVSVEGESGELEEFLQSKITLFCAAEKITDTWVTISPKLCEVRLLRIPKVSGKLIETTIFWTLKKEASFNEKDFSFDYEIRGESDEHGNKKLDVMCCMFPLSEIEARKTLFSKLKIPLSGISIAPLAIQNIFINNQIISQGKNTTCLFIGNNHSRIDLYSNGKLIVTRNINTGINSIIDILTETLGTIPMGGEKLTRESAREILLNLGENDDTNTVLVNGNPVTKDEIERLIVPVFERFTRQIERTFEHFALTLGGDRNIEKIYISNSFPAHKTMLTYFSSQLGVMCDFFDPFPQTLKTGSFGEHNSLIVAFGMALSDNAYTPNFIYTYKEKKKTAYAAKINKLLLSGLIMAVIICSVILGVQRYMIAQDKAELSYLEQQLKKNAPLITKDIILQITATVRKNRQRYAEFSARYAGMAIIAELSDLTPKNVNLNNLKVDFAGKNDNKEAPNPPTNPTNTAVPGAPATPTSAVGTSVANLPENTATIEGVISGKQNELETLLNSYVMKLKTSRMFSDATVLTSKVEPAKKNSLIIFTINLKIGLNK